MNNDMKTDVRGRFEKSGRAVFISHLDLLRTMQRALKRSGIPVWYSQGFNPRIYLNFPLALALGVASNAEAMDFCVTRELPYDELTEMLNAVLPQGLCFYSMAAPVYSNKDIGAAEYHFEFYGDNMRDCFESVVGRDSLEMEKRSKSKGMITLDIKPYVELVGTEEGDGFFAADIRLPAGNSLNINSGVFADAFIKYGGKEPEKICVKRTKILTLDGDIFK